MLEHTGSSKVRILTETESIILISLAHSLSTIRRAKVEVRLALFGLFLAALSGRPPERQFLTIRRNLTTMNGRTRIRTPGTGAGRRGPIRTPGTKPALRGRRIWGLRKVF